MKKLTGRITNGNGAAAERFQRCNKTLQKYGLNFPPLHFGTINVKLDIPFKTPYWGIIIPSHELDEISLQNREDWQFIPVESINGENVTAYVLRTSINIHGEQVAEVVTEYLDTGITAGDSMEIEIMIQ